MIPGECRKHRMEDKYVVISSLSSHRTCSYYLINQSSDAVSRFSGIDREAVRVCYPIIIEPEEFLEAYKRVLNKQIDTIQSLLNL